MKKHKKVIMTSLVASSIALTAFVNPQVNASSNDNHSLKIGGEKDYQEAAGPHLMVNITGLDKKGNEILHPHYVEFPIKPGTFLTKKEVIKYVEWTLDASDYNKYKVLELAPNSKIEVSYYSKKDNKVVTQSFPITDKGFVIPDLSEHIQNPSYNLVTNVVIEEKNSK
ncbi:kinase [Staphylococcus succinus]|nr:kinase [Staphylococcus succinus]